MNRDIVENNENVNANTFDVERMKQALPEFFDREGNFLMEKFQDTLNADEVSFHNEGYRLDFVGKSFASYLTSADTETIIVPDVEHNNSEDNKNSENLYIVGDNLDALKHLKKSYAGKIKCIYIDPPYNTGKDDFGYHDTFNFGEEDLIEKVGLSEEEAERTLRLHGKSSHSAWLSFMMPRLKLAKDLLTRDGIIYISIDDNEQSNLALLCTEVFGEANHVATFVQDKGNSKSDKTAVQKNHEYILCYSRGEAAESSSSLSQTSTKKKRLLEENGKFFYLGDPITTRARGGVLSRRENLGFTIYFHPTTRDIIPTMDYDKAAAKNVSADESIYTDDKDLLDKGYIPVRPPRVRGQLGAWTWELDKVVADSDQLYIKKSGDSYNAYKRHFVSGDLVEQDTGGFFISLTKESNARSLIQFSTNDGTNRLTDLIGPDMFTNPKNVDMLSYLIGMATDEDDIVLDFFSGSASTADAVLGLNADDGGSRSFILVQLDEEIKEGEYSRSLGYRYLDEIGRLRVEASAKNVHTNTGAEIDYGFKLFRLEQPSAPSLRTIEEFNPDEGLFLTTDDYLDQLSIDTATGEDIVLTTWMNQDNYTLTPEITRYTLDSYELPVSGKTAYIVEPGFTNGDVVKLVEKLENNEIPINRLVYLPYTVDFHIKTALINNLKQLKSDKSIDVIGRR